MSSGEGGAPIYMDPKQYFWSSNPSKEKDAQYDRSIDVFSLGVTLLRVADPEGWIALANNLVSVSKRMTVFDKACF
jgi:hypothetical protein